MIKFHAEYEKNRIYIKLTGIVTQEDVSSYLKEIKPILNKLQPQFSYISNLLEVEYFQEEAKPYREQAVQILDEAGVGPVIRIVFPNIKGRIKGEIANKFSTAIGLDSHIVNSVEEAERLLDQLENK